MGVRKDPRTGEIIETPTKKLDEETGVVAPPRGGSRGRGVAPTAPIRASDGAVQARGARSSAFEARTKPVDSLRRRKQASEGPSTQRYRPKSDELPSKADDALKDAVVGWLVVVDGPGKGHVRSLGYGVNSLGRGDKSRVTLDFGDEEISREDHASVTYDPKGRKYYLQHGGGVNLTYLDDEPVLAPTSLEALRHIVLGGTTLRFVPLCGQEFDWQDLS